LVCDVKNAHVWLQPGSLGLQEISVVSEFGVEAPKA
jgi:hypothetical protein